MSHDSVLSPISIRGMLFRNRIIMPSMVTNFAGRGGEVSEKLIRYHEARARGGVGLNILEATSVHDSGRSYFPGVSISDDKYIQGLSRLAEAVHAWGGRIGVQLHHAGRLAKADASGQVIPLVSFVPGYTSYENSKIMENDEIEELIEAFAAGACRAEKAGFDLIEIHGAHGYLISQFMSPFFNHRTDCWGGSYENRMRFPLAVIRRVRETIRSSIPLSFRISVEEFLPGGMNIDLACRIAKDVVEAGIDLVQVSVGLAETNRFTGPPPCIPEGWNADRALQIKTALNGKAIVSVAGRILNRVVADDIIAGGKADMVNMGRALIADPDLPDKLLKGMDEDIIPCIGCNEGCNGRLGQRKGIECAVNPCTGREGVMTMMPVNTPKKVVIVGGGPAGMEAALSAAMLGHKVTLLEKTDRLGGLINVAKLPPHKEVLERLNEYYMKALAKHGIQPVFNHESSAEELAGMDCDALFVATGSLPSMPRFLSGAPVISAEQCLRSMPEGKDILILGGGLVGSETAELLAVSGKQVTILELRAELAPDMHARARTFLLNSLKEHSVRFLTETEIISISSDGVVSVRDKWKNEYALPRFDVIVTALGYRSQNELCRQLAQLHVPFIPIGDCTHPGKIMDAIHSARQAVCRI